MSNPTTYLVLVGGTEVARKSKKASAIEFADGLRKENATDTIEVQTSAGTVVHTVKIKGTHAKPWTRTETHEGIEVEVPSGYTVAYTRKRVGAVVARADDKSGYLVLTASGDSFEAKNTVEAREITNQLAADHAKSREAEKAQAAKDREAAKAKREADRAAAREAKEKAKAEKAAAKDAAAVAAA
jgi:hypothetical protein